MRHSSCDQVKDSLISSIDSLLERRYEFLVNPQTDFTRTRKISFEQTVLFPMLAGSDNVATELFDFFGEEKFPLPSAMIQRRNQIKPEAFQELFYDFGKKIPALRTFQGYLPVACDGSRINLPYNPADYDTFIQCIKGRKGINQMHLNALYDILNNIFLDVELQGIHEMDEQGAFCRFLDKQEPSSNHHQKRIYIADRGYASYNVFAHAIHNQKFFLIRVQECFAKEICKNRDNWLTGPSHDEVVSVHIGRRKTKKSLQLENCHYIPTGRRYDFAEEGTDNIDCLQLRVLKFAIGEDSYEYIVTNLPTYDFSLSAIKRLYNLRWNEEVAFRYLKYSANMVHIHSLKKELLLQEIYGKLTFYNFSSYLLIVMDGLQKETEKHRYVINHVQLQKFCIRFLRGTVQNIADLISRFLVPVRPGRKFARNLRCQSADTLTYR